MQFHFTTKATGDQTSAGVIEAASSVEARQHLREQGLFALSLKTQGAAASRPREPGLRFRRSGVRGWASGIAR